MAAEEKRAFDRLHRELEALLGKLGVMVAEGNLDIEIDRQVSEVRDALDEFSFAYRGRIG